MNEQTHWHRLFENDFPPPNVPLWVAHNETVQPGEWHRCTDGIITDCFFTSSEGNTIYGTFWCLIEDVKHPPPYPGWEDTRAAPEGFECGWPPEDEAEPWKGYRIHHRLMWKKLLRKHKLLPPEEDVVSWQSIERDAYPPSSGDMVWLANGTKVCKGRWLFAPDVPRNECAFEDEAGNPFAATFWCPLEDSADPPTAPAQSVPVLVLEMWSARKNCTLGKICRFLRATHPPAFDKRSIVVEILDELKGPPTTKQVRRWLETTEHSTSWLAQHLGMDSEDVVHCLDVGFDQEDLNTIAGLMTHPREILPEQLAPPYTHSLLGTRIGVMSDDTTKRTVQDRSKVSLSEDYEVQYWSEKFGCTKEELQKAVDAVGNGAKKVEEYFASRKQLLPMCGRYSSTKREIRALEREFELNDVRITPRFNIAPTQTAPVIVQEETGRYSLQQYRWGLLPFWAKTIGEGARMINARSETVAKLSAYRAAFKSRRCLVVADGFYEWIQTTKPKQPMRFVLNDQETPMPMAGLWETWRDPHAEEPLHSFTICTTTANELVGKVHDRMPVILPPMHWHQWLDPKASAENLQALLVPLKAAEMKSYPVTPKMNNARFEDPSASDHFVAEQPEAELPMNSQ